MRSILIKKESKFYVYQHFLSLLIIFSFSLVISYYLKKMNLYSIIPKIAYFSIPEKLDLTQDILGLDILAKLKMNGVEPINVNNMPKNHPVTDFLLVLEESDYLYNTKVKTLKNGFTYLIVDQDVRNYFMAQLETTTHEIEEFTETIKYTLNVIEKDSIKNLRIIDSEAQFEKIRNNFQRRLLQNVERYNLDRQTMLNYNKALTGAEIGAIAVIGTVAILGAVTIGVTVYNKYY